MNNIAEASCTVKFFQCGHFLIDKNTNLWKTRHLSGLTYNKLYYNLSGEAVFTLNDTEYKMIPGYLYFIPKYTTQSFKMISDTMDQYYLHFDIETADSFKENIPLCVKCDEKTVLSLFNSIMDFKNEREKNVLKRSMHILALYDYYLSCANETIDSLSADRRQTEIINFVKKNYKRSISPDELADVACLTPASLPRYFKKTFGMTPVEFINAYRIDIACLLLAKTDDTVAQIAKKCGFSDHRYFSRVFKKRMNCTPLQCRNGKE